jgi:hypothetical protein
VEAVFASRELRPGTRPPGAYELAARSLAWPADEDDQAVRLLLPVHPRPGGAALPHLWRSGPAGNPYPCLGSGDEHVSAEGWPTDGGVRWPLGGMRPGSITRTEPSIVQAQSL